MHAGIDGNSRQHAATLVLGSIDEHRTVRSEARRLVLTSVREYARCGVPQAHNCDAVRATIQRHHRQLCAVRRNSWSRVVTAFERDPLCTIPAAGAHAIDLRCPGTVGSEIDTLA